MEIIAFCPYGYDGTLVTIEIEVRRGIPGIDIVGLPDSSVRESRERVRAALRNSGFSVPKSRLLVNLSPAGIRKVGAGYDLAIAAAILSATGQLPWEFDETVLVVGELALSGAVLPVRGMAAAFSAAAKSNIRRCIVPTESWNEEAGELPVRVLPVRHLGELRNSTLEFKDIRYRYRYSEHRVRIDEQPTENDAQRIFFSGISWLDPVHRLGLAVSVSGGHHTLLLGPPGVGKTSLLNVIRTMHLPVLPCFAREVNHIHSLKHPALSGGDSERFSSVPVRMPHSTASYEGIFGGGKNASPGEVSLAHAGFLLLDEIMNFPAKIIAGLRIPMEDSTISVVRADGSTKYPAAFTLWAAANLCPCGSRGRSDETCLCDPHRLAAYWNRLGAALIDRFDIRLMFPSEEANGLPGWIQSEKEIESRIREVRRGPNSGIGTLNGRLPGVSILDPVRAERSVNGYRSPTAIERLSLTISLLNGHDCVRDEDRRLADILRNPQGLDLWLCDAVGVRSQ